MAGPAKKRMSRAQKLTGPDIVAVLGLITIWLLVQQTRLNPAVTAVLQAPGSGDRWQGRGGYGRPHPGGSRILPRGCRPELQPGTCPTRSTARPSFSSHRVSKKCPSAASSGNSTGAHLEVFVYDMGEAQNAYAVFSSQRRPGAGPLPRHGQCLYDPQCPVLHRGKFYMEIVVDRAVNDLPGALETFTHGVVSQAYPQKLKLLRQPGACPKKGWHGTAVRLNVCGRLRLGKDSTTSYTRGIYPKKWQGHGFLGGAADAGGGRG